jgi:2-polyprenyl-3-methyl-5-hydroxy-6-metoxy-1,4-benzoquinol methylase/predicted RNA-binding Zn-ribbon protein involved in translation (DUF1610 family)
MGQLIKEKYRNDSYFYHCSACGGEINDALYRYQQEDTVSRIYKCQKCGFMFARPLAVSEIEQRKMEHIGAAEFFGNPILKWLFSRGIVSREIRYVRKALGDGILTMLDIGCGTGWITGLWKEHGFDVTGLEPSESRGAIARERYGIQVTNDFLENLNTENAFDVVAMRQVLEHFEDPLTMLKKAGSLLKQDGLLIIVVPNIDSIGRLIFGTKWSWILPYHCNFFNPTSLSSMMRRAGLRIVRSYQTPSPLWYPRSFLRSIPGTGSLSNSIYKKLSIVTFAPFVPLLLMGYMTGYSDNLTMFARRA